MDTYSEEWRHICECKSWAKRALRNKAAGTVDVQVWWSETFDRIKRFRGDQAAVRLEQGVGEMLRSNRTLLLDEIEREGLGPG